MCEVAVQFHGLTLNGGFLNSFEATETTLNDVAHSFEALRLKEVVDLLRAGIALVPGSADADRTERAAKLNALSQEAAALLDEIQAGAGPGSFEAKWTLKEWRAGKLTLDW